VIFLKPKLKYFRLNENARTPTRASRKSACWDLYAAEDTSVVFDIITKVSTGLRLIIPKGYRVDVKPRSGLFYKHGIIIGNSPGTIDEDYPGETCVLLTKVLRGPKFRIKKGDRIAQISLEKVIDAKIQETTRLPRDDGDRRGGFGSTGR